MPIQAQITAPPVASFAPLRFFATLAPRVFKLRGFGAEVPELLKLVLPWSVVTRMPLYFTVPVDVLSYTTWDWVTEHIVQKNDPIWVDIERQWDRTGLSFQWILLSFGIETVEERHELERFLSLSRTQAADGSIVVEVPQVWFIDP